MGDDGPGVGEEGAGVGPFLEQRAARMSPGLGVSIDLVAGVLLAELAVGPGRLSPVPAAAAAVASVARIVLARRAARQCLARRASLT